MDNATEVLKEINWDKELTNTEFPTNMKFEGDNITKAISLAERSIKGGDIQPDIYENFDSKQKIIFMMELEDKGAKQEVLERVDSALKVTGKEKNPDILLYWLTLNIPSRLDKVKKDVEEYLKGYGRAKYITPVYTLLAGANTTFAKEQFDKNKANYNPRVVKSLEKIILKN